MTNKSFDLAGFSRPELLWGHSGLLAEEPAQVGRILEIKFCGYVFHGQIGVLKQCLDRHDDLPVYHLFWACSGGLEHQLVEIIRGNIQLFRIEGDIPVCSNVPAA